ncbi:hypothetical protein DKT77_13745 [Meridianimarinicoccus roseus]|uniref:Transglutaminase superfamily protein n=1 Tax=Meridianimarinicoccus roseus TaxID=2072018 RepID=A0A2V2LI26_9RHOB|nr:hypothetical protein [Meridianimarinicoccus roseus]PWR02059.1 hypothetical protein DKT77_13745 [Meridianimarinicoccus roseus]
MTEAEDHAYAKALDDFLECHVDGEGRRGAVQVFHAVRALPYRSGPDRTPLGGLRSGRCACTARHMILRDALRRLGFFADVEMVSCDFAAGIPPHPSMPPEVRKLAGSGGVRDVHCWVRARLGENNLSVLMDATWCDAYASVGFPVNTGWNGTGDTRPAAVGVVQATPEDVLASKEELLAVLTDEEASARKAFLAGLSAWLEELPAGQEGGRA